MDKQIEISENAIKKAVVVIAHEIEGVADIKQVSYVEEAGSLLLDVVVTMKMGTMVRLCAENLQAHFITQFKELFSLDVKNVNISVKSLM